MERTYKLKDFGFDRYKPSKLSIWPSVPYKIWIDKSWNINDMKEKCDLLKDTGLILKDNVFVKKRTEEEKEMKYEWEVPSDDMQLVVFPKKLTYQPKINAVIAIGVAHKYGIDGRRPAKKRKYKYKSKYRKSRW